MLTMLAKPIYMYGLQKGSRSIYMSHIHRLYAYHICVLYYGLFLGKHILRQRYSIFCVRIYLFIYLFIFYLFFFSSSDIVSMNVNVTIQPDNININIKRK